MSNLFVDVMAASAAADGLRAAGGRELPTVPSVDAGSGPATEALAVVASSLASFNTAFAIQTTVVATAVSVGVADTVAADGAPDADIR